MKDKAKPAAPHESAEEAPGEAHHAELDHHHHHAPKTEEAALVRRVSNQAQKYNLIAPLAAVRGGGAGARVGAGPE